MIIIGFDPGKTTGLCVIAAHSRDSFDLMEVDEIEWEERFNKTYEIIREYNSLNDAHVVVENFLLYVASAKDLVGNNFPSAQMIGIIGLAAHLNGIPVDTDRFGIQNAALIHNSKARMKAGEPKLSIPIREEDKPIFVGNRHALDAYAHCVYYLKYNSARLFPKVKL